MPGDPLPFLHAFTWFFLIPIGIFALVWLLVVAGENLKKAKVRNAQRDLLSQIPE
jgi:hypothetical protein